MIMFHAYDKSLPQIIISLPQMIIFVSHGLHRFTQIFFIRTITLSRGGQTSPPPSGGVRGGQQLQRCVYLPLSRLP